MHILDLYAYEGPNPYHLRPMVRMLLDLGSWDGRESLEAPGFNRRLLDLLPGLAEHYCSRGHPGGFLERLQEGTWLGHVVEHVALELQARCGLDVRYGRTRRWSGSVFAVVFEHGGSAVGRAAAEGAVQVVSALLAADTSTAPAVLQTVAAVAARECLGPSTRAIQAEARRRGIPVRRLEGSLLELGQGVHRRRLWASVSDRSSAVAVDLASDKQLAKRLLAEAGVPVPAGTPVHTPDEAVRAFFAYGPPVVVKPANGNQGRGVTVALGNETDVRSAFALALQEAADGAVIVERHIPGRCYRVLVVAGQAVAAAERRPPIVVGDGVSTVQELVARLNADPRRGEGHARSLTRVTLDDVVRRTLARQHLTPASVPALGQRVWLRHSANLSTGGTALDVTSQLHPLVAAACEQAARALGLDIAGVDVAAASLAVPLADSDGAVLEVNACPGLRMHLDPDGGSPHNVAAPILRALYPEGDGRIPLVAVTGTNGKTTVTRLIAAMLEATGRVVGCTYTGAVEVAGREVLRGDTTGPKSARVVLSDPRVEAAVLETARGGIMHGGLAFDACDVAVLTNIGPDHLGQDGLETVEDLVWVKSLLADVVRDDGWLVLNADDPLLVPLAVGRRCRVAWFTLRRDARVPVEGATNRSRPESERTALVYVRDGRVCLRFAGSEQAVLPLDEVPLTMEGRLSYQVANVLAAVAAGWAVGVPLEALRLALQTFDGDRNPGRFQVHECEGVRVIVDYGHNAPAWEATLAAARRLTGGTLWGVVGVPGDRRDDLIVASGGVAGRLCDRLVVKEDADLRGRPAGAVASLLRRGAMESGCAADCIEVVPDEAQALRRALDQAQRGDAVVVFYERLAPLQSVLEGAAAAHAIRPLALH